MYTSNATFAIIFSELAILSEREIRPWKDSNPSQKSTFRSDVTCTLTTKLPTIHARKLDIYSIRLLLFIVTSGKQKD